MGSIIFSAYTIGWPFVSYNLAWSTPEEINFSFIKLAAFLTSLSKFLFSIFIINAYFFSALSISEVFEDYIQNDKIKNVANKLLFASAVVIPLITIILISKL